MRSAVWGLGGLVALSIAACGHQAARVADVPADAGPPLLEDGAVAGPAESIFVVPSTLADLSADHYFDHPWPSDYRRDPDGTIVVAGLPDPFQEPILETYVQAITGVLHGFSIAADGYLRFATDLDPSTLPASPRDTLDAGATVQLINVDPGSPEHGRRHLAETYYRETPGDYWSADTLVVGPASGYPLLPSTKYAIVVTRGVHASYGASMGPSADLAAVLGLAPTNEATAGAKALFAPALAEVAALGMPASSIAHFTAFTTNDPTAELFSIADDVPKTVPAPSVLAEPEGDGGTTAPVQLNPSDVEAGVYDVYSGWYGPSPNYQQGTPPYTSGGGNFVFDSSGHAVLQNTFPLRFTLVVPNAGACPMPAGGYPILIYAHGTGGDYRSVIEETGSVGDAMARQCVASIGTDQIFHGARPGAPTLGNPNAEAQEELAFYNFSNPAAMRTNTRQSAIDIVQEARLFTETKMAIPASVSATGSPIAFDPTKLLFMGHSQGSLNGPLYFAADSSARGGILSGASSGVPITLLDKTSPTPSVAALWKFAIGLAQPTDAAELNVFHPVMSFAQTVVDPIDPLLYMAYVIQRPRPGHAPKSIYQTEGVNADGGGDTFAPVPGIELGSVALGLPLQAPAIHPVTQEAWSGILPVAIPPGGLSGNLANGAASGVLAQFIPPPDIDGHFVFFDVPQCRLQAAQFAANLATNPKGNVPALSP